MPDVLALWRSGRWRAEVDAWVEAALARHGRRLTGPGEQVKVRFWSTVVRYPTDAGDVWCKECNPGQAFEPELLRVLARLVPRAFAEPLAVAGPRVLLPHLGPTLAEAADVTGRGGPAGPVDPHEAGPRTAARVLTAFADVQRELAGHGDELRAAGLPVLTATDAPRVVADLALRLAALPATDAQHLDAAGLARVRAGTGWVQEWSGVLAESGVPDSFQHHDLSPRNTAVRPDGRLAWFDVGDGFWSHPFAVVQVPLAMATGTWPFGPDTTDPAVVRALEAYLARWDVDLAALRPLAEPARLLAQVHRAESWRRLLDAVPADRLGREAPRVADWLLAAAVPPG